MTSPFHHERPPMAADMADTDIAIVGMAGRFPGAPSVDALWDMLSQGVCAASFFSDDELRRRGVPDAALRDPAYVKAGMVLDGMEDFDAAFFGYAPREAARLDPQHRLFLEVAWEALEHAGQAPGDGGRPGLTGVVAGTGANAYLLSHLLPHEDLRGTHDISALLGLMNGNDKDSLSTCVAYKLDLRGPAVTVQTACSTSLVAVHLACRSLLNHEVDLSLAGGVWLNLSHRQGYLHQSGAILSPDGLCRAFDARAQGTVIGSGAGVVVLKRLADALQEGDTIHAVIKGSAINNDGGSKIGYAAPSVDGQAEVIMAAQAMAGVSPDSITMVEAHGTGTALGDPIEFQALTRAFRAGTDRRSYCALGSVKTNVGHLDAAAGVTGLIKAALALRQGQLPPSLHFERPNPHLDIEASPFYVNTALREWPKGHTPRRAAVSSFGMGGTNAHVILQEPPPPRRSETATAATRGLQCLPVSARTPAALAQALARLGDHLRAHPQQPLCDVACTLQTGRRAFAHRAMVVCEDPAQAVRALAGHDPSRIWRSEAPAKEASVVFLLPGQGAQHVGMAARLYENEPVFRGELDRCLAILRPLLGMDLRQVLYPGPGAQEQAWASEQLARTALTQPALFVVEYALARLWMSWGVTPACFLGHSIGEYVAACLAGVWTLEEALTLVAARGRLLQALPEGAMLAVALPPAELGPYLAAGCELAAVNAPSACVLSGPIEAIDAAARDLAGRDVAVKRLQVSHAFHSSMLAPMLPAFRAELAGVASRPPRWPFVSNVTGRWITPAQAVDPDYWVAHLLGTVRFAEGLDTVLAQADSVLLEVGPGETLSHLARRHSAGAGRTVLVSLPHPDRATTAQPWCQSLARLWLAGVPVDWARVHEGQDRRRVPLPTYPFERQRHWIEPPPKAHRAGTSQAAAKAPLACAIDDWFHTPVWHRTDGVAEPRAADEQDGTWLVFGEAHALGGALMAQLRASRRRGVLVEPADGEPHQGIGDEPVIRLAAADQAGYETLWRDLVDRGHRVTHVIHAWSVDGGVDRTLDQVLDRGFFSLRGLTAAMGQQSERPRVTVVAHRLHDITGNDAVCPQAATLLGACLTMPQEVRGLSCHVVEVTTPRDAVDLARTAIQVLAEAHHPGPDTDRLVAYRGMYRWVRRLEPVRRARPALSPVRHGSVYLIVGGLGGIGRTLAAHLARTAGAKLVLLGRSATLPPRDQWPAVLSAPPDPSCASPRQVDSIRTVMALEALGAEVMVLATDITDEAALRDVLALTRRRFGALHGVIHAAGEAGRGAGGRDDALDAFRVMAAKVQGAQALRAVLHGERLDTVLLCSSLSSVTGGVGQAAYSAANACLDAMAQAWRQEAGDAIGQLVAVGWDGWREVGMAADMAWPDGVGIAPDQGGEVFDRLLAGPPLPQVLVSTLPLAQRMGASQDDWLMTLADAASAAAVQAPQANGGTQPRPALARPFEAPADELAQRLAGLWQDLLGIAPVGMKDNLFELGGDSLLAIQLLARVKAAFGVAVQSADFFRDPTVAGLAVLVESRLIDDIEHS